MNVAFGASGRDSKWATNLLADFAEYAKTTNKDKVKVLGDKDDFAQVALSTIGGKTTGVAESDQITLVLSGFVNKPLPGWKAGTSPLDDPNATAGFLLNRYKSKGQRFLEDVYGHFSVMVVDKGKKRILLATDPHGHNDMFYYISGGSLAFSTKSRSLAESLGGSLKIDRSYEDFFLIYGFYPKGMTMYEGVKSLPGKTLLTWQGGRASTSPINYKKLAVQKIKNESQLVNSLYKTLMSATKDILPSGKKKVAVLLGGFDSALIAALLKKNGADVETFSFYYEDDKFNQKHTNTVADHLGIKHNWVKIDEKVIEQGLREYSDVFNLPTNWPNYVIQTAHLAKAIRKRGFEYCYTGDGCDYLFFGYPITYQRARLLSAFGAVPNPLLTAAIKMAEVPAFERVIGRPYQVALGILRGARRDPATRNFLTFRIFDELSLKQLRGRPAPSQAKKLEDLLIELSRPYTKLSPIRLAYQGKMELAPYRIKMNGSADATGLVLASPYLHHAVKHFALSLPDELLRPLGSDKAIGKYILAKMAETKKLLPYEVIYQPKMGAVDAPLTEWYNGPLKKAIYDLLEGLPFKYSKKYVESLIRPKRAEDLYGRFISKDTSNVVTLSHCISLLVTYAHFTEAGKQKE